ncbi:PIG-U-domain-containing protein [Pluteus cervinus]|uniref:PIG-U-domain-containing protein n=1 Tax=Pluteus cervinus TaxID=181527 RepID=A0ACD3B8Y1_9AGAR|nr:PIG-U-domain-containing protein [Pluteus cervinus]
MPSAKTQLVQAVLTWDYNLIFPCLLAIRLLITLTGVQSILEKNHQLTTPLTSYANLQEGIYLFNRGINPYDGGYFRHSPLFLSLFSTILPNTKSTAYIIWTLCDGIAAWALVQIWRARQGISTSSRDLLITTSYLFNPYLVLPSLALSTSTFENTFLLLCIMFASQGKASFALLTLALLVHLSLSTVVLIVPVILLLLSTPKSQLASPHANPVDFRKGLHLLGEYLVYFFILIFTSTLIAGNWNWVSQTWGTTLTLPDLTPNIGLWWYFFTEMFDHFRPFFLMVFSVHLLIYIAPICIKFQYDPLFALFVLIGITNISKAYPTLADPGVFLTMISIFPELYPYFQHPIVTTLLHLHASLLLPLFHQLWLVQGTGNANFFYASTLVLACANGAALRDCIWAGLRIALGPEKEGYIVVQE